MQYLKKRGQSYYVRVVVPDRLRAAIGKREYTVALRTRDPVTARRKSHEAIAAIMREMHVAEVRVSEARPEFPEGSPERILEIARETRAAVAGGMTEEENAEASMDVAMEQQLDVLRAKHGTDEQGDPKVGDKYSRAFKLAWRIAQGEQVWLLSEQVNQYLAEVTPHRRAQTLQDKRRVYGEFQTWLGHDSEANSINRKVAGVYVSTVMARSGKAPKTLRSELAQLSALWKYMLGRGVVDANIWELMSSTLPASKRGGAETVRRPWTTAELQRFFAETDQSDPMWSAAALSLYGGLRLEELCQLKITDYADGALSVRETKSKAGVRAVPVHAVIVPLMRRLAETSADGYLLPGLLTAGRDSKRSVYLSKRIGWHIRRTLKITDESFVFHGLRHTFTNALERAGVPLSTAQLIVGHSRRGSITYGAPGASYSSGLPLEQLADAVAKVSFGALDGHVKKAGGAVKVTLRSARRPRARATA